MITTVFQLGVCNAKLCLSGGLVLSVKVSIGLHTHEACAAPKYGTNSRCDKATNLLD